jgi:ATP-binding cassette subfamily F protein uup
VAAGRGIATAKPSRPPGRHSLGDGGSRDKVRPRKLSFKEQRELDGMEAAILTAETHAQELEKTLNDPEFHATRSREAHGVIAELEAAKAEVARLYERWHELDRIGKA